MAGQIAGDDRLLGAVEVMEPSLDEGFDVRSGRRLQHPVVLDVGQGTPRRANPGHQIGITYELLEACQLGRSRGLAHLGELTIPELVQAGFECLPSQKCRGSWPRSFQTQLGMGRHRPRPIEERFGLAHCARRPVARFCASLTSDAKSPWKPRCAPAFTSWNNPSFE